MWSKSVPDRVKTWEFRNEVLLTSARAMHPWRRKDLQTRLERFKVTSQEISPRNS
jgi:hypothetical protein